jgi:hypothetical protein
VTGADKAPARIRPAEPADAAALTELAQTSKAAWGYDAAFMAACRAELTIRPESILRDPTYLIESAGHVVGFDRARCAALGARPAVVGPS